MRVPAALALVLTALTAAACDANDFAAPTPTGTAIRTVPPETTAGTSTTVPPTAYRTVPTVTAGPPAWAPAGWRSEDVERFRGLIAAELDALGAEATIYLEAGYALLDSGTRVELTQLAAQLATTPAAGWQAVISTYLLAALAPASPDDLFTYESAGPSLRVLVSALDVDLTSAATRTVLPGLVAVAVFQGTERLVVVDNEHLTNWGRTADEVLTRAVQQTLAITETPDREGAYTSLTDDIYASARLLDPSTITGPLGPEGVVVSIPSTDVFLAVAVTPDLDRAALVGMHEQGVDSFTTTQQPASDDLYWWHDGLLEMIPFVSGQPQLPAALAALVDA
jgi:hypothetical protein